MEHIRIYFTMIIFGIVSVLIMGQAHQYYGAHITDQSPWINKIIVYNNGNAVADFQLTIWDTTGQMVFEDDYSVAANNSLALVLPNDIGYVPEIGEIVLTPVEGTVIIDTDSEKIRPKFSFQYGDSQSLTEFFAQETLAWEYILPNPILEHFSWTGLALMNPYDSPLGVILNAYLDGQLMGQTGQTIDPHTKYVSLSDWIWAKIPYDEFDQIRIYSTDNPFPPPMSITGNETQDRHVFFNAAVTSTAIPQLEAGELYAVDSIVGNLRYVPGGVFTQGSQVGEPCRWSDETQFTHTLTRNLAVMETEVTRQMWTDLSAVQNTLPSDPTHTSYGAGMTNPVQNGRWYRYILFANLLSVQQGLTPCYYTNASMTTVIDWTNYETDDVYCHFDADGYRLPTEGEWEYFCRAGTPGPFWIDEPLYNDTTCGDLSCDEGTLPTLESVAVFCYGLDETAPVGGKAANPWNLKDVHGNVGERCWDWHSDTYPVGSATDYQGPASGTHRAVRGGNFRVQAWECRSAFRRSPAGPGGNHIIWGFRLVRTID